MPRGRTDLGSGEYDNWLASRGKHQEVRDRHIERKAKGYEGWHFGLGDRPVKTNSKEDFKRELERRGLMLKDDVKRRLK